MFRMQERFKAIDGYHVIEIHDKDEVFRQAVIEAMKVKGYDVYGFSDLGDSVQYNFVTAEFAEVLKERHHASCRNSLGGAIDPQVISRAFRKDVPGEVKFIDHQAYPDTLAALDAPNPHTNKQILGRLIPLTPDVQQQLDRLKAMDEPSVVINVPIDAGAADEHHHHGFGSLEPGLGSQMMGTGRLDD